MQEIELQYIEARAKVRGAVETLREMSLRYMEITKSTMLTYFALHYPHIHVEIMASMQDLTSPQSFDFTLHFQFKYTCDQVSLPSNPMTSEVWNYIHTLDIPLIGIMQNTVPDTTGDEDQG